MKKLEVKVGNGSLEWTYYGRNILSIYVVEWYMTYVWVCGWIFTSALGAWKSII